MARGLFMGLGALGALSAAVTTGVIVRGQREAPEAASVAQLQPAGDICIESGVRLVEGMSRNCMTSAQFEALRDRAVLGGDGRPIDVNLSAPKGTAEAASVRSCADYDLRTKEGWYALSGSDIRREEYFRRACGALNMLVAAKPAAQSYFANGHADAADIRSMVASDAFGFGEASVSGAPEITREDDGVWKIADPATETMVYEIAHGDFTGDGLGEILAYVSTGVSGGAARGGSIGLIEKPAAGGPCAFKPT
jgi:hypothetical protein